MTAGMVMMRRRRRTEAAAPSSSSDPGRRRQLRLHWRTVAATTATAAALVESGRGLECRGLVVGCGRDGRRGRVHVTVTHVVQLRRRLAMDHHCRGGGRLQ